jgi:arylsulfatase A-like enzyme
MHRRDFFRNAAFAAAVAGRAASATPSRPNLLFLMASQWRAQALPGTLGQELEAPSLRRLATEGVQFNRVYTCCPLSTPSRAALMTGRFPHATGVRGDAIQLPLDQATLSGQLKDSGYRTGFIGQWQLDGPDDPGYVPPGPRRRGFEDWAAFNRGDRYFDSLYFRDRPEPIYVAGFEPDGQTDLAIQFIEQNRQHPFFTFVSWGPPHPPRIPLPRTAHLYDPRWLRIRDNVPAKSESKTRTEYSAYYALCTAIDQNIGRLLAALDRLSLAENTIVVFTSDHGDMLGSQGLEDANVPFEESVRVPLLIRYPRELKAGVQREDILVSNVDLMPTLLSLCGVPVPRDVQGKDLSFALMHGQAGGQESVFAEGKLGAPDEWRMLVRGLDKLVVDSNLEVTHLFNLGQDSFELENLAREISQELKRNELKALLNDWMRRTGDRVDTSGLKKRT